MIKFVKWGSVVLFFVLVLAYFWPEQRYTSFKVSPSYQAQVDDFYVPDMPPDWVWAEYQTVDGTRLRWGQTGNRDAAKATFIFVPGYTATLDMYGEHFDALARRGYHVIGLDMRGQGGSERHRDNYPEKLWIENFGVYGADINEWLMALDLPSNRLVILAGSSFGGHTVLRAAGDIHELPIDGIYLFAPAIEPMTDEYSMDESKAILKRFNFFGRGQRYVMGQGDWRPETDNLTSISNCSSYAKRLHYRDVIFTRQPEQRVGGVTNKWFYEFLLSSELINQKDYLSKVSVPVTIITAETDDFVSNSVNTKACTEYLKDCREIVIPDTKHCLLKENDQVLELMWAEVDSLLERITSSDPY